MDKRGDSESVKNQGPDYLFDDDRFRRCGRMSWFVFVVFFPPVLGFFVCLFFCFWCCFLHDFTSPILQLLLYCGYLMLISLLLTSVSRHAMEWIDTAHHWCATVSCTFAKVTPFLFSCYDRHFSLMLTNHPNAPPLQYTISNTHTMHTELMQNATRLGFFSLFNYAWKHTEPSENTCRNRKTTCFLHHQHSHPKPRLYSPPMSHDST